MYNPKSTRAEEFISHEEILATLDYAEKNKRNAGLSTTVIRKAKEAQGLSIAKRRFWSTANSRDRNEEIYACRNGKSK